VSPSSRKARSIRVRGVVQGVGFRPFVYRLAREHDIAGWVANDGEGVAIHAEGTAEALVAFARAIESEPPPAARIASLEVDTVPAEDVEGFTILVSGGGSAGPTVRISPDLATCADCLAELADPADRRHGYPYVNCTSCGPRYSIVLGLPYDRPRTTMKDWPLCADCAREYEDPGDRRFHAQPVACPACGPGYRLEAPGHEAIAESGAAIREAARRLRGGEIVAVKGLGGYHLACDAGNEAAVAALRERKFREEKPFAVMVPDLPDLKGARRLVDLAPEGEALLRSVARPIVLAPRNPSGPPLPGVAPGHDHLGVMLPYTPLHTLLFAADAPEVLVLTSANRSSEPIATRDDEARERLAGIADAFLVGERPIARRVDDSVARADPFGPTILRRARGWAPGAVARLPYSEGDRPVLAVGADLKNTVCLVVGGEAFVSQHVGDLSHYEAFTAFRETIDDLLTMYRVDRSELLIAHDLHPEYASTRYAEELAAEHGCQRIGVQHHRAHIASVLAERGELDRTVVGVALDGTGYGDDGSGSISIWGGEIFVGSVRGGFDRAAHLRPAVLPGGDAAARRPVQAAAGYLWEIEGLPDLTAPPFGFPDRYAQARELIRQDLRTFPTTSTGRLFDTAAALLGFTREITYEGQAAIWLEQLARRADGDAIEGVEMRFENEEIDYRPALRELARRRLSGEKEAALARAFHHALARAVWSAATRLAEEAGTTTLALSGGVFQNRLLLEELATLAAAPPYEILTHREVPPNDGGISLGQTAIATTTERGRGG
jgi:hydrogenase maturation protein HypF